MKTIGFIKELNGEDYSIEFEQYFKETVNKNRDILIEYLEKSVLCVPLMGSVDDPLDEGDEDFIAYQAIYTDGEYIWPQYVIEFLKKYPNFYLNEEFVNHVKNRAGIKLNIDPNLIHELENKYYEPGEWSTE